MPGWAPRRAGHSAPASLPQPAACCPESDARSRRPDVRSRNPDARSPKSSRHAQRDAEVDVAGEEGSRDLGAVAAQVMLARARDARVADRIQERPEAIFDACPKLP